MADVAHGAGGRPSRPVLGAARRAAPSEHRVADLASAGLSTLQIAHELFITRQTVESHLSSVYRKLEITGQAALSAVLADDTPPTAP